jgi:Fe-S-cluster containining protein
MNHNDKDYIMVTDGMTRFGKSMLERNPSRRPEIKAMLTSMVMNYKEQIEKMIEEAPLSAMASVHHTMDEMIAEEIKGERISCAKGCAYCCHINVDINLLEAMVIVHYCNAMGIDIDYSYLKQQGKLHGHDKERAMSQTHSACVFLKNNECSIYPVRPINCRKYLVGTDPKLCDATTDTQEVGVMTIRDIEAIASGVLNAVEHKGSMASMIRMAASNIRREATGV